MKSIEKINELRSKLNQFDNPSDEFIKAIKKECENAGIDSHLVVCSDIDFETICKKGNLNEWKL